jgi:enamine deaminase RidA (YjgF/YER057c/UK114 family)
MIQRIEPGARMSQAVIFNRTVYLAGQVANDDCGPDVHQQTVETLASVDKLLAAAGTDKTHLLSATVYLTDMAGFADMNRAWDAWISRGNAPARATVQSAKLAAEKYKVEIVVVAALPG